MSDLAPPPARSDCLTEDEVAQVRAAAPGVVPEQLARHLSACVRCQERALFGSEPRRRRGKDSSPMPTPMRAFILLAIMIAVMVVFFYTLNQFVGDPYR